MLLSVLEQTHPPYLHQALIAPVKAIFGYVSSVSFDFKCVHTVQSTDASLLCSVLSFSKEAECDLCPDVTRRPPGLLQGRGALPSAPHLDGQSDCGLRQRHVPVGEAETAVPKWPHE